MVITHNISPHPLLTYVLVPTVHHYRPGRHTRNLNFNHFRTIGMRRSVEDGLTSRFVTGPRVELVLKVYFILTILNI